MRVQEELESISEELRIPGSKPLNPIAKVRHVVVLAYRKIPRFKKMRV